MFQNFCEPESPGSCWFWQCIVSLDSEKTKFYWFNNWMSKAQYFLSGTWYILKSRACIYLGLEHLTVFFGFAGVFGMP